MFGFKAMNSKLKRHHLATLPARMLLYAVILCSLTLYDFIMQGFDTSLNTNITFEHYHVSPKVAHFFKNMGSGAFISNQTVATRPQVTSADAPLFELESKLNPVFLEHGELNVYCRYGNGMNFLCYYIGVIKEPKYYIQEVTFNNTVPDVLPYKFEPFNSYKPPQNYTNSDTYSKLAAYFYIFENLPGQVYRYPTLESISETRDFRTIRDRVAVIYLTVIRWTYISNYAFWLSTMSYAFTHFIMLVTIVGITYLEDMSPLKDKTSDKFFKRLQDFSIVQLILCFFYFIIHRLIVLLNGVVQCFLFSSLTEGITFNTTKSNTDGVSIFNYIFGFFMLLWILALFHHITFKENLVLYITPKEQEVYQDDEVLHDMESRSETVANAVRNSMYGDSPV